MKEEIIKLATKLKFSSEILSNIEWKHSSKESLRYYLWLCELNWWLLVTHDIYVCIMPTRIQPSNEVVWCYTIDVFNDTDNDEISEDYDDPKYTFELGLLNVLKRLADEQG